MIKINNLYQQWLEETKTVPDLHQELVSIANDQDEIAERFYKNLEFGTAGLRGVLGAGSNRMNIFTVNQVTQGLAQYLKAEHGRASVSIAYDSRINSELFAKESAGVLAANGIKVFIYRELMPTPMLSFAVRRLGCQSGIIITASHNPAEYNGYKCYDPQGYQMTDEAARKTYEFIQKTDIFKDVKTMAFEEALASGLVEYIGEQIIEEFYELTLAQRVRPALPEIGDLKVIYSPLHGAGNKPVREIFKRMGLKDVKVVPEQEKPDGNFPTAPYPNPEIRQAFECAIKLAQEEAADLLLATDPDCDRVGIAVYDDGEYKLLSGNEVAALLTHYILKSKKAGGNLSQKPLVIKSFVTTDLIEAIADDYACQTVNLLTGFKYIGEYITELEKTNQSDRFVLAMEESYGYLAGTHARDKDAVGASMLICEMAAFYKAQAKNLVEVMQGIYEKYGFYENKVLNFAFEGKSGMLKMQELMEALRKTPLKNIAGLDVLEFSDYKEGFIEDLKSRGRRPIGLPKANVVAFKLPAGNSLIVRPSGTEPKLKIYITAKAQSREEARALAGEMGRSVGELMGL
ncbi:MAG: phospho-sugar mutase [Clostridiales bacterium]|nr:phospho-sugar mutase [Clostridiales bacterium]